MNKPLIMAHRALANNFKRPLMLQAALLAGSTAVSAQAQEPGVLSSAWLELHRAELILWGLLAAEVLVLGIALVLFFTVKNALVAMLQKERGIVPEAKPSFWKVLMEKMTRSVPIEREAEVMTNHAYDGIRELDNRLPPWWVGMFYATIIYGVIYLMYFHVFNIGPSSAEEYENQMAKAEAEVEAYLASLANSVDENNVTVLLPDDARLVNGKAIYDSKCVTCHGPEGQGLVGPNFADKHWLYGGGIKDIFKTVKYGTNKGMQAWNKMLTPAEIQDVSSFIWYMEGTNPPNPKEPQGEVFERDPAEGPENNETVSTKEQQNQTVQAEPKPNSTQHSPVTATATF